jgi:hypothetical protein
MGGGESFQRLTVAPPLKKLPALSVHKIPPMNTQLRLFTPVHAQTPVYPNSLRSILLLASRAQSVQRLGWKLDDLGSRVRFPTGAENFSLPHHVQNGSRAHPASYPIGTRGSFAGVKRTGREADQSPSSAEVKNAWNYTSIPKYAFIAWCSV